MNAQGRTVMAGNSDRLEILCWLALAAVHASPAAVLFRPSLLGALYDIPAGGPARILLVHRGGLFLAVVIVAVFGALAPGARKAASLVVATSVISFLIVYAGAGAPEGGLRRIALVDAAALPPLAFVCWRAWRPG
jgi:hypothetical protein